jgi:hypothetical protein
VPYVNRKFSHDPENIEIQFFIFAENADLFRPPLFCLGLEKIWEGRLPYGPYLVEQSEDKLE